MLCRPSKDCDRVAIYLPATLRQRLIEADDHRCAYCRTSQANSGSPMVVDHLLPLSKGGGTAFDNLCFACYRCNLFKGSQVTAIDPLSGEMAPLFHARRDRWGEHFAWDEAGLRILGLTARRSTQCEAVAGDGMPAVTRPEQSQTRFNGTRSQSKGGRSTMMERPAELAETDGLGARDA